MQLNLNCIKIILLSVRKSLPKLPASVTTCARRAKKTIVLDQRRVWKPEAEPRRPERTE